MNVAARLEGKSFFSGGNAMAEKDWERKAEKAAQKNKNFLQIRHLFLNFIDRSPKSCH
ncbi:hypothetical protein RCH13_001837 [Chryseobacterium sp. MP_3.2]|nr:hypothetical protein [Chryseobacterium sp. MP_3.2]